MCRKHAYQLEKYGKVLDTISRTRYDKNEIIKHKDYAEIILYDKKNVEVARTKIDIEDIEKCKSKKWCVSPLGYCITTIKGRKVSLHRFIMNCDKDFIVDHINHDTLDNRKYNLRICNQQENMRNQKINKKNTSSVKGVSYDKKRHKWKAYITLNNKQKFLGRFDLFSDAKLARIKAEKKYFKEFSNQY